MNNETQTEVKPVLDATCGSRMIWFDKENPLAVYVDRREVDDEEIWRSKDGKEIRRLTIKPDVIASFTDLPFSDDTFYLVVFDPPHLNRVGDNAWICKKYGRIDGDLKKTLRDGFDECMRVLKPYGTLIFKWNEVQISVSEVIDAIGQKPLFGSRNGKNNKTIWMTFMKI